MTNRLDTAQVFLSSLFGLVCIVLVVSFVFDKTGNVANTSGYTGMIVFGTLLIYTGNKLMAKVGNKDKGVKWFRQPLIIIGIIVVITAIMLFFTHIVTSMFIK